MNKPIPSVTAQDLLEARPVPNQAVRSERSGRGELVLKVALKDRWYLKRPLTLLLPVRRERGYALDRLGEEVWQACNGRHTAEEIIDSFARHHHLRFHEARLSVMQYLRHLTQRGLLVMVGPDEAGRRGSGAQGGGRR